MKLGVLALLIWCSVPHLLLAAEPSAVRFFAGEKQLPLRGPAAEIERQIMALLQSSNFHSGPEDKLHIFTAAGVQQDYRDAVAGGEYLLMRFSPAKKLSTVGGEVTVAEIVIGMRAPSGKNTVFTIDDAGTVTSHAKYSGVVYLELKKAVAAARE
jgi:hypothetical protein